MNYLCQEDLLKRKNWNPRRIRLYLGDPDCYAPNPNGAMFRKMKLFDIDRIISTEISHKFRADVIKYLPRRERIAAIH